MSKRPKPKKKKVKDPKVSEETVPHKGWDIYKSKFKNGHIVDGRSGEGMFYRGGRKKDIPLEKFDSYEDKKRERDLWRRVRAGERFAEPKKKDDTK